MQGNREREEEGTKLSQSTNFSRQDLERITRTEGEMDGVKRVQDHNFTIIRFLLFGGLGALGIIVTIGLFIYDLSSKDLSAMQEQTHLIEQETRILDAKIETETRKLDVKIDGIGKRIEGVESNIEKILIATTQQNRNAMTSPAPK